MPSSEKFLEDSSIYIVHEAVLEGEDELYGRACISGLKMCSFVQEGEHSPFFDHLLPREDAMGESREDPGGTGESGMETGASRMGDSSSMLSSSSALLAALSETAREAGLERESRGSREEVSRAVDVFLAERRPGVEDPDE